MTAHPHLLLKASYVGGLLGATLVQYGCGRGPAPVPRGIGGGSWVAAKPEPIPGIDQANVVAFTRSGEAVAALWFAAAQQVTTTGGNTAEWGVRYAGQATVADGRQVVFGYEEPPGGPPGKAVVAGTAYDLSDGRLLLVSMAGGKARVLQLKRDIGGLTTGPDYQKLAEADEEIIKFFRDQAHGEKP